MDTGEALIKKLRKEVLTAKEELIRELRMASTLEATKYIQGMLDGIDDFLARAEHEHKNLFKETLFDE